MVSNGWTSVGTAATLVDGRHNQATYLTIHNNDNTDAVYIGNSNVTTTTGLKLNKEESYQFILQPLDQIFAVSTKAGHNISWMRQTV